MRRQLHDRFPVEDNVLVRVWRVSPAGVHYLDEQFSVHNLLTNAGKDLMGDRLIGSSAAAVGWFAIGTGTTAPTVADTALATELSRDVITSAIRNSVGLITFTYYLSTSVDNGSTLAEIGLFNAASVGTMVARALLTPTIAKDATKAVTFNWNVTYA